MRPPGFHEHFHRVRLPRRNGQRDGRKEAQGDRVPGDVQQEGDPAPQDDGNADEPDLACEITEAKGLDVVGPIQLQIPSSEGSRSPKLRSI